MGAVAGAPERPGGRHLGQPALARIRRGSSRRSSAASSCRPIARARQRLPQATPVCAIVDRQAAIERAVQRGPAGRPRADRRQGPREVPGDRRSRAAVRRRRRGAERAGAPARRVAGVVARGTARARPPASRDAAAAGELVHGDPGDARSAGRRSTRARSRRATSSSRFAASGSTGTTSSPTRWRAGAAGRWSTPARGPARCAATAPTPVLIIEVDDTTAALQDARARGSAPRRAPGSSRSPAAPARRRPRKSSAEFLTARYRGASGTRGI